MFIFVSGIIGYSVIEKWSFLDSLYMTVITLTTVGFMEVNPLSSAGRIFTIFFLIIGFSVILYGFGSITAFFIEGELMGILRRRKMEKRISRLTDHFIICGSGETGKHVINEFIKTNNPHVVIEKEESEIEALNARFGDVLYILGDASSDAVLLKAGIGRARGLITTFASDKDNLFVVLTARSLNPDLRIVARSIEEESERKLRTAGADSVVSANLIGGMRMASEMLRPTVVTFLNVMLRAEDEVLRIEEAAIHKNSKFENMTIKEADLPKKIGLLVIAIKHGETGKFIYNPPSDLVLKENDTLIVLGGVDQIEKLRGFTAA